MSTTKAFEIPTTNKASAIKRRFQTASEQPKGAPTPSQKDDLTLRINTDRRHETSPGLALTLDVFPDFRWIMMSLMYYANVYYSSIDIKNRSKTSPATMVFYFLSIIYAHFLVSDLYLRDSPSFWANDFMNDSSRRDFLEFLLALPVPDILMKFIETLSTTSDPRRPHIKTGPSFAGYSYEHDYGRFFPISIFGFMHQLAATVKVGTQTDDVWFKLFEFQPITGMYTGALFAQHVATSDSTDNYGSKLFQSLESLFNPLIERSLQRRNTYAPTPMHTINETKTTFNPYILALNCDYDNMQESQTILESVSAAIASVLSFKGQLGTLYDSLSGLDILRHGYSSFSLPTWVSTSPKKPTLKKPLRVTSDSQHASSVLFLQKLSPTNDTTLKTPDDQSKLEKILYLVKKGSKSENFPSPTSDFRLFKGILDVSPRVRVLDPYDLNVSTFASVIFCGLIIESFEVDGSAVLQPDTDVTLDNENSQVLQSALPLSAIRKGTDCNGTTRYDALYRELATHHAQKASTHLVNTGENRLGTFDSSVDQTVPTELPMFRIREHTSWFTRMASIIAFRTKARDISDADSTPRTPAGHVIAWSPYRYVARTWTPSSVDDNTYMLLNFRTVYGSNVPLAEIAHPLTLLPIN